MSDSKMKSQYDYYESIENQFLSVSQLIAQNNDIYIHLKDSFKWDNHKIHSYLKVRHIKVFDSFLMSCVLNQEITLDMIDNNIIEDNPELVQVFEKVALNSSLKQKLLEKDIDKLKKI